MSVSTILHSFKEKIEDAAAMVRSMDAEEKLQAVEYWNVVSEQLQIIVNHSAEDMIFQMDEDEGGDFIDASQLVALGLAPPFMTSFVTEDPLDVHPSPKDVEGTVIITTPLSENVSLPTISTALSCPTTIVQPAANTSAAQLDSCQPLPADGIIDPSGTSTSQLPPSVVGNDLMNTTVGFSGHVQPQVLNIHDQIEGAEGAVISQVLDGVAPVDPLQQVDALPKPVSPSSHHPAKTKGKKTGSSDMENFYECSHCRRIFLTPSQLTAHIWLHTKPYICSVCHARFSTKGNLVVHNRRHSGERPFVCALCEASFSTKGNLLRHRKGHSGEKPWQCSVCPSRFTEKKSLKVHMRRHTGERPYHCSMCPKSFTQAGILHTHIATHLDQRDYSCELCSKSFRQKSQLRLHEQRHAGLRKYQCSQCPSKFLTKGDMERHKRVHTGERPFTCKLCQKSFTRQQSLNEHMNRHYGLKPYQCKYCNKGYVEMSACYKHIKTHERAGRTVPVEKESVADPEDEDIAGIFEDSSESIHRTEESNTFFIEELI